MSDPDEHEIDLAAPLLVTAGDWARLEEERNEARHLARLCYWRTRSLACDLRTGKPLHVERHPWLKHDDS